MKNKFSSLIWDNLPLIFFSLMILPFAILFIFNHPSADDWGLSENTRMKGFYDIQVHYYNNWTGKYFSNAVLSFNPLYFRSLEGYKFITLLLMILFIIILYNLISVLSKRSLNSLEKTMLTFSVVFLYLYAMPSLSQSFYWLTASVVYQAGLMMIMLFLILYAKITDPEDASSKKLMTFFSVLLLIAISGCSEMAMVTGVLMIALIVISKLITDKKLNGRLILFLLTTAISSYVLLSAPGNKIRGSQYPDSHKLLPSIMTTLSSMADYLISWIFLTPLIFVTILTLPVIYKIIKNSGKKPVSIFVNPVYTSVTFLAVLFVLFFTPVWSLGRSPFNRTVNVIYFVFLLGWFYNIAIVLYQIFIKYNFNIIRIPKYVYTLALIITVIFLFKKNNVKNVYSDLLRGSAAKYDTELNERYDMLFDNNSDSLTVKPLVNTPRTIYFTDITADPNMELNRMYAHYFNKRFISVDKPDTTNKE